MIAIGIFIGYGIIVAIGGIGAVAPKLFNRFAKEN